MVTYGRAFTFSELEELVVSEYGRDWGPWRLDAVGRVLYIQEPSSYEIDLDSCTSSAEVLDWICQIAGKSWALPEVLAGLVMALDAILYPQRNLCSCGTDKRLSRATIARLVEEARAQLMAAMRALNLDVEPLREGPGRPPGPGA